MNPIVYIQRLLGGLFIYIINLLGYAFRRLRFVGKGIPIEDKIDDFFQIFRNTLLFFVFNVIALLVFTLLPQGKDVILLVIEDLSGYNPWSLLSLLGGLLGWCIISEFGARYKIYVTDNSGLALTDERVNFRKEAQKFVSSIYLLLPIMIMMVSVIVVSFNNIRKWETPVIVPFVIVLVLLLLMFAALSRFYLDAIYIRKLRKKKVWYKVKEEELRWANKLYGIYNDFVFLMRKETNFKDENTIIDSGSRHPDTPPDSSISHAYKKFIKKITSLPRKNKTTPDNINTIENFPRNYIKGSESVDKTAVPPGSEKTEKSRLLKVTDLPPAEFPVVKYLDKNYEIVNNSQYEELKKGKKEDKHTGKEESGEGVTEFEKKEVPGGYYRWIYQNKPSFYKTLHLQVYVIAISSLLFMFFIATGYLFSPATVGSPGLVCLSFGCWLGIYTGLLYLDYRYRRQMKVSLRWLLLLWFFIVSYIDSDHPVRNNGSSACCVERPGLGAHFNAWRSKFQTNSMDTLVMRLMDRDTLLPGKDTSYAYPVYFITAEGGGLRTGAFTALLLAKLQDIDSNFRKHIYAFSTVSGGSVGIAFFNAISYLEPNNHTRAIGYNQKVTKGFFSQDQLAPVLAKLFYGEVLGNFWPQPVERFDRAVALEKAWEHSYATVFNRANDKNVFSSDFLSCYKNRTDSLLPAWFINTTEVETGMQCYISNVKPTEEEFLFARQRDLLGEKIRHGINYSTAVNFSSRFPLFSPSAALRQNDDQTYHYVDGGYVENTGSKTMLEILQGLRTVIRDTSKKVVPYVIQLRFSESDSARLQQTGFLNEIQSVFSGIYNTRSGASATYCRLLEKEVTALGGKVINVPLPATNKDVPMSWVFSASSLGKLDSVITNIVLCDTMNDLHTKMPGFFINKLEEARKKRETVK